MYPIQAVDHVRARNGFGDAGRQLRERSCRIAYLGNSITAQRQGYRPFLHARLVERFGRPHHPINAGLSATGSIGCVYTLPDFVLRHSPDVCFIECTTGDRGIGLAPERIGPVLEGIVRRLLKQHCAPCNLHLYRYDQSYVDSDPIVAAYESLLEHYRIPSINIGRLFERMLTQKERETFNFDGVHLSQEGAKWVADIVADAVVQIGAQVPSQFEIPVPKFADHYEFAVMKPAHIGMVTDASRGKTGLFRGIYPYVELTSGNAIEFRSSEGPIDGVMLVIGPYSGFIEIEVEGIRSEYLIWDRWCIHERLQVLLLSAQAPPNATVRIAALDKAVPDPAANVDLPKRLRIGSFLIHRTRANM